MPDASTDIPTTPGLTRVATLDREIHASLERIWENVLDWEHLPHLHSSSFASIELLEQGASGWRAMAASTRSPDAPLQIEVRLEREALRYVSRTVEGDGAGTEIWTSLVPVSTDRTRIRVEFWLPGVPADMKELLGTGYETLSPRLWDEDEAMMMEREACLREGTNHTRDNLPDTHPLGPLSELRRSCPLVVDTPRGPYRILRLETKEEWIVHSAICPHLLGPLHEAATKTNGERCEDEVQCPWHGYRFDIRTGRSTDGHRLRLPAPPRLETNPDQDTAWLRWPIHQP